MNGEGDNIVNLARRRSLASDGNGNGGGNLVDYRLQELERRVNEMEQTTKKINDTVIKIDTKLDGIEKTIKNLPSKSYVLWYSVVIIAVAFLSILGHVLLKQLPSGG